MRIDDEQQSREASTRAAALDDDTRTLEQLGYSQQLSRRMSGFSNVALSMSIICILSGGINSFHLGLGSVGGASIGIGWPLVFLFSLVVAATMAQIASAFPTAGGLYHWAAILGGPGWGWCTAWFNLVGLVTVLAAINVGTFQFVAGAFFPVSASHFGIQCLALVLITGSQAVLNHLGIRVTTFLTDLSGYWILAVSAVLTIALLAAADSWDVARLVTFVNFSGLPSDAPIWPRTESLVWLFALGFLLPAYTITGFDASAHAAEETVGATHNVPHGIVRSVWISGLAGWIMLVAVLLAIPDLAAGVRDGSGVFFNTIRQTLTPNVALAMFAAIAIAQYFCGLATVTSASRMLFAFARDGGLPGSRWLRRVCTKYRTPDVAIWTVAAASVLFTLYTPVYSTITAVCTIFLYVSYVLPTAIGFVTFGRAWTRFGPWHLGRWFRPLAAMSVLGCTGLIVIGMQPPNEKSILVVFGAASVLAVMWFLVVRRSFRGPPCDLKSLQSLPASPEDSRQGPMP